MNRYQWNPVNASVRDISDNSYLSDLYIMDRMNKLQAVADVAGDILSDKEHELGLGWIISSSTISELERRYELLSPKTIDQLQKERNEAADALRHYMENGLTIREALNAYDAAVKAHEAALKANK